MSDKRRSINTKFWDDPFIQDLTPSEKLLFLYLITNPLTNLLGIYEISIKRISFDTGLSKEIILKGLESFETIKKIFYQNNFIIIPNFLKNQNLNANMKINVVKLFEVLPNELKTKLLLNGSQSISNDYRMILNGISKYKEEIEIENKIIIPAEKTSPNNNITNSQFDDFWKIYPKKVSKGVAKTAWERLCNKPANKRPTWKEIKKAIYAQIKSEQWQNSKYIPHAPTWLNNSKWLDDPNEMKSYTRNEKTDYGRELNKDFGEPDEIR